MPLADAQQPPPDTLVYGQDHRVTYRYHHAVVLWFLGYPDHAQHSMREALTLAQTLSHPFSLALTLSFASFLHVWRREVQAAYERAEALIALSTEQGFAYLILDDQVFCS